MSHSPDFVITKRSASQINYTQVFAKADSALTPWSISSLTVSAKDDAGLDVTATLVGTTSYSGNSATARLKAGTDGENYVVTFTATMTTGEIVAAQGLLKVEDISA